MLQHPYLLSLDWDVGVYQCFGGLLGSVRVKVIAAPGAKMGCGVLIGKKEGHYC